MMPDLLTRLDFIFKSREIVQRRDGETTGGIERRGMPGMNWVTTDEPGQAKSGRAREKKGPAWKRQSRRGRNSFWFYTCMAGDREGCTVWGWKSLERGRCRRRVLSKAEIMGRCRNDSILLSAGETLQGPLLRWP